MPNDVPNAAELWEGAVSFFSIDTDLIQSAGFDFSAGALNKLPAQLPSAMSLQLSEVVVQEVVKHLMEPVLKAIAQFKKSSDELKRSANLDMASIDNTFDSMDAATAATSRFRRLIEEYAERCRGSVLPIEGDRLTAEVFARYFSSAPPFAQRKEKKSEFPDATTLLLLEAYARKNQTKGIFAARDGGASEFAAESEYLYCVKSIDELAALFAATGEHAEAIKARVVEAMSDETSALRAKLHEAIEQHVGEAEWDIGDIYSGVVPRVEGEASGAKLKSYDIHTDQTEIWESKNEAGAWIIELTATAQVIVTVDVTFFVWDSIDREELPLDTQQFSIFDDIEVQAFLSCSDINLENEPEAWRVDVDIAPGGYGIDVGEVEPEFDGE